MNRLLHPEIIKILHGFYYRVRFLGIYIFVGVLSILLELTLFSQLHKLGLNNVTANMISLFAGILFAFFGNVFFNFRIPPSRRNRAFVYFMSISLLSWAFQWVAAKIFSDFVWSYEQARFLISGSLFMVAYVLHRRFSFRDFKRVGVAIYANGVEDLQDIHNRIGQYPDFIHVDIVDPSFAKGADEIRTYRMETIKAFWPNLEIHTHIMSMTPSRWLSEILPFSDTIFIHQECQEQLGTLLQSIRQAGKRAGIALTMRTTPDEVRALLQEADAVLLLTIAEPGHSGQKFDLKGFDHIKQVDKLSFRNNLRVCVDGGVNEKIIGLLKVEDIVSGSCVLNHASPKQQILRLQTSGRYEAF